MDRITAAALELYKQGLIPIPLQGKKPMLKHWPDRFLKTPLLKSQIVYGIKEKNGFITYQDQNIGILTGKISNVVVIDIDDMKQLAYLRKHGKLLETWAARSSRGIHLYYSYKKNIPSMKLVDGVDILSDKKIVVAPPSIHPSGKQYNWLRSPNEVEKKELPTWLENLILEKRENPTNPPIVYKKNPKNKRYNRLSFLELDWIEFYSRHLKGIRIRGKWGSAKCPFHDDHHNSFGFNIENGSWVCFAHCGKGNGLQFIQSFYTLSKSDAFKILMGRNIYVD
ncbi:bifunctional DNA primase/polymerase [Cytobacillus sp. Bac17]|uniref:bifunctional DNA primase/polymerase n=1 Tax=Cytobacillus sp. Bac17 TaxID=2926008 RepID=UPI002118A02F|nr:bifunctional DNA primase/polymerase [Cytobacillus sp. Bac17]